MSNYFVRFTDTSNTPIIIPEESVNRDSVDVSLFGRIFQNYGEEVNEDLLNLLENFSCPEAPGSTDMYNSLPDISSTSKQQLSSPIKGQFWFNSTRELMYFYNGVSWTPIRRRDRYAANWGKIIHGQFLPKPYISAEDREFEYHECIWSVSPAQVDGAIEYMNFASDNITSQVTAQYRVAGGNTLTDTTANYLIIGIDGNVNTGSWIPPLLPMTTPLIPSTTPVITNTPYPSQSVPIVTATPTPNPVPTPTISVSSTNT